MNIAPSASRRNVVLTMETSSNDSSGPEVSTTAKTEYLCICLLIDDGVDLTEACFEGSDQAEVLGNFWQRVQAHDQVIGYNVDDRMAFLRQRSWELDLVPSRQTDLRKIYSHNMLDTMTLWASSGDCDHLTTEELAQLLGVRRKGQGNQTGAVLRTAEGHQIIVERCRQDARLTFEAFHKLTRQPVPDRYSEWHFPLFNDPNIEITVHSRD